MRKRIARLAAAGLAFVLLVSPVFVKAAAPETAAKAYALLEASTGRLLACKNADEQLPMASTTKIMTCLLAVEQGNMDQLITVDKQAVGLEGTSIYLKEGETLPFSHLVYGLMLASGNDAAAQIAITLGGSPENFAAMMNERAKELGAENTNFVTPNGLPHEDHYTTAADLARIAGGAMQNEAFRKIVATTSMDLPADEDSPARYLRSKNKILYEYEGGNGVKTGYTKAAGKCLVAGAKRGGMQLIAVVLNDYAMFDDCKALLDYGFANYAMEEVALAGDRYGSISVTGGLKKSADVQLLEEVCLPLSPEEFTMVEKKVELTGELAAPVEQGQTVGTVEFSLGGQVLARGELVTAEPVARDTYLYHFWRVLDRWLGAPGWRTRANREIYGTGGSRLAPQV
ncbi:MAG: D-alanyl-D-alanine carboxypeptidase [Christensenellaceae bacterium]|nr:D-alanyl-D-alanine carboxypeptidase [Christensenellaceae bacterium]